LTAAIERRFVGDVAHLERRAVDVNSSREYEEIGIRSFGRGIFHKGPVSGATLGSKRVFWIKPGDLVLNNVFAWEGAIAVADLRQQGLIGSHRFMTYVVDRDRVDPRYLLYYLLSDTGLELIRQASPGSAGRNRTLGIKAFESLEIPLPPINVQRYLGQRLTVIRDAALRLQHQQSQAALVANALPSSIAQRPDLSSRDKKALGWKRIPLREMMSLAVDMHAVRPGRMYPNVGIFGFGRGVFEKQAIDGARTSARMLSQIRAGQFIYSRLFAFEGAYAAVPPQYDFYYVSNEFPTFDLDPCLDAGFLAAYFRSPTIWDELRRSARGLGVRRQRIHAETLLNFEIWLPPISVQKASVQQLGRLQQYQSAHGNRAKLAIALTSAALNHEFANLA
jgi:type I restriction enzyme, S subunit